MAADVLDRPLAAAWDDLPPAWRMLCGGLEGCASRISAKIDEEARLWPIAPARPFRAFELVAPDDVRLVLIGQDPYPLPGDADGLAFSSTRGIPSSMRNVYAAIEQAHPGFVRPPVANLAAWAAQGVLLLNTALTVRSGAKMAGTHLRLGWQEWTGGVLRQLYEDRLRNRRPVPVAWLWGKPAKAFFEQATGGLAIPPDRVLVVRHPSNDYRREFAPLAAAQLKALGGLLKPPIRW